MYSTLTYLKWGHMTNIFADTRILIATSLLIFLCLYVIPANAQDSTTKQAVSNIKTKLLEKTYNSQLLNDEINSLHRQIVSEEKNIWLANKKFETAINTQNLKIKELETQLHSLNGKPITNGTTFEVWAGILLACVAIMVTILSVMLAFFQIKGIANAKAEAVIEAGKVAHEITPRVAEDKLLEHVREGGFNKIIEDAIDKVAFSNINDPEDYTEDPPNEA